MGRRLFNLLCAISLLLLLATAGDWVRSEFYRDGLYRLSAGNGQTFATEHYIGWERGGFLYKHTFHQASAILFPLASGVRWDVFCGPARSRQQIIAYLGPGGFYFLGFGGFTRRNTYNSGGVSGIVEDSAVRVPHWFVMLLFAIAPARWALLKRREIRRRPRHLCKNCGYDLRATPEAGGALLGRCPECGREVEAMTNDETRITNQ